MLMQGSLIHMSQLYQDDSEQQALMEIFGQSAKMFAAQAILSHHMQRNFNALLKVHFEYQQAIINQGIKAFLPKINMAEQNYTDILEKFLKKRLLLKDQVKDSAGLGSLEKKFEKIGNKETLALSPRIVAELKGDIQSSITGIPKQ